MNQDQLLVTPPSSYTPEQMRLITDVVAKNASKDELALFLYRCKNLGLDPLKPGQIYFVKYGSSPGTIVVGIDGFRARASRTDKLAGIKRGAIRDASGALVGAWAEVYRKDWTHPAREEVPLAEYNTGKAMWLKMPETMIKKVAEAAALRMAFPDELGGVYERAEMDQADSDTPQADTRPTISRALDQPPETDGVTDHSYKIPFGKWKARSIEEVYRDHGRDGIHNYLAYLESTAEKEGKPIQGVVKEFIGQCEAYIAAMENAPIYAAPAVGPPFSDGPAYL